MQWVARRIDVPLTVQDWRDLPAPADALDELARQEVAQGFDLAEAAADVA